MAENKNNGRAFLLRDVNRLLVPFLIVGGGGLVGVGGNTLSTRLDAEVEARKHLYAAVREIRAELRTELREHIRIVGHPGMEQKGARLEEKLKSLERRIGRYERK